MSASKSAWRRWEEPLPKLLDPEELFRLINEDERLADMFQAAVQAAMASGSEDKVRLLGHALATGALANDEAAVDEAQELLRVAAQLEAVDFRAMLALRPDNPFVQGGQTGFHGRNPESHLESTLTMSPAVAATTVARLRHLGLLAEDPSAWINDRDDSEDDSVNFENRVRIVAGRQGTVEAAG